ncbi:YqaJ viral recombinase family protein [Nonomuraea roseoviolacea]|uniref:Phage-type endonuclease n=1 Tax=Nonomuraea roseoviolacea subsp. carminata TaxID=160689 RepID=A0ABT1K9J6_9ACTN|nr:YqaJ viral recombinase family protein [Nonomuraea roseoviolacea]MCP2350670.1 putative phage-type endonuclease [Nonomuraea roseoviolacea subsp. carminata]
MSDNRLYTPTGRYLGRWEHDTPEWHAARAQRIGGSRIAAILGLSPWASPHSTWCEMAGLVDAAPATPQQDRGHYLEPAIAAWFADQHPDWHVFTTGTWVHQDRGQHLANPDRLIRYNPIPNAVGWFDIAVSALLEIKTDADGTGWGEPGTDEIPLYYRTQVQWYMDVLGLQRAHIAVLSDRLTFAEYVVDYDPADAALLRQAADDFLDSLLWREMPDLDGHPATYETLRKLHPDIDDTHIDLDDDTAIEYLTALAETKTAEARVTAAKSRLAAAMGTARRARWRGQTIATRQAKNGGTPYLVAGRKLPDPTTLTGAVA